MLPILSRPLIVEPIFPLDEDDRFRSATRVIEQVSAESGRVLFNFDPDEGFEIDEGKLSDATEIKLRTHISVVIERILECYPGIKAPERRIITYGLEHSAARQADDPHSPTSRWHIDAGIPLFVRFGAMQNRTEVFEGKIDVFSYLPEKLSAVIAGYLGPKGGYNAESFLKAALDNPDQFGLGLGFYQALNNALIEGISDQDDPEIFKSKSGQLFVFDHQCVHRKGPLIASAEGYSHTLGLI